MPGPPAAGVPETLANERAAAIADLGYDLAFRIPELKFELLAGNEALNSSTEPSTCCGAE